MTITFFSSVLNHHQKPLCDALDSHPQVEFRFVQTGQLEQQRKALGYTNETAPYIFWGNTEEASRLCRESDIVIAGVVGQGWVNKRIQAGKITFAYKERFLKASPLLCLHPAFLKNGYRDYFRFRNKPLYMLCASAYTAQDTACIFPRKNKKFKWGYFPQTDNVAYDAITAMKIPNTVLCVSRFLELKRLSDAIAAVSGLHSKGYSVTLEIVGNGPLEQQLKAEAAACGAEEYIRFLGSMPPAEVRRKMRSSEIFLFPSNRQEGWGAVLNEAMSEGCACVASRQAGSTPYLIQDGFNGYSFHAGDVEAIMRHVAGLLDDCAGRRRIQKNAYDTIYKEWNAPTASDRFVTVCAALLENRTLPVYTSGPMSKA